MTGGAPAVFLDRDGVLCAARVVDGIPRPPRSANDVVLLPGVRRACADLAAAGFKLIVVTNQPDIARGVVSSETVSAINEALVRRLGVHDVYVCPHDDADGCSCRKPAPGMLLDAASRLGLDLPRSFLVGDRWRDIEAGIAAGCQTIHVDQGYSERPPVGADVVVASLAEGARWILTERSTAGVAEEHEHA